MTGSRPARPEIVSEGLADRGRSWVALVTSSDHKAVGRMYIATALTFLAAAITLLVMMRIQLFVPDAKIKQRQKTAREALKHDPKFQQLSKERAAAWHRQQTYLHEHDSRLSELEKRISESDER